MGLSGALSGEEKIKELEEKKKIITDDLTEITRIISDRLGEYHKCYVEFELKINIIPNEKL